MVQTVNALWDTTPSTVPLASGLLDHATIEEDVSWQSPRGIANSFNCLDVTVPTPICRDEDSDPKEFSGPGLIDGFEFAVYGGINCKPFGFDERTGLAEIERVFALKESRGVERALMETRFIDGPLESGEPIWDAAVDITPAAGAVDPRQALARLEGFAASTYAGQPTIHAPYTVGALLAGRKAIQPEAGKFYSRIGSKVALGAGYEFPNSGPTGAEPAAGELWMYATGEVMVARSGVQSMVAHDQYTNDIRALAERRYIAAVDCFVAAIRVSVE